MYMGVWRGNPKEGATGTPRCRWEDNIKWIFKKWDGEAWTGLIWLKIGQVAITCACSNELSGSIKSGKFFGISEDLLAFQEGLCSL